VNATKIKEILIAKDFENELRLVGTPIVGRSGLIISSVSSGTAAADITHQSQRDVPQRSSLHDFPYRVAAISKPEFLSRHQEGI
jgi:hypothetical protein